MLFEHLHVARAVDPTSCRRLSVHSSQITSLVSSSSVNGVTAFLSGCSLRAQGPLALACASSSLTPLRRRHFKKLLSCGLSRLLSSPSPWPVSFQTTRAKACYDANAWRSVILSLLASKAMLRPEATSTGLQLPGAPRRMPTFSTVTLLVVQRSKHLSMALAQLGEDTQAVGSPYLFRRRSLPRG